MSIYPLAISWLENPISMDALIGKSLIHGPFSSTWNAFGRESVEKPGPRSAPFLRGATAAAYTRRWASLVAIAAHRALAASLLELPGGGYDHTDDGNPQLHSVLADARHDEDLEPSRLPLRAGR